MSLSTAGLLFAIAFAQVIEVRNNGRVAAATADVGSIQVGQESLYVTRDRYVACADAACTRTLPAFRPSDPITYSIAVDERSETTFALHAKTAFGNKDLFSFVSGEIRWQPVAASFGGTVR